MARIIAAEIENYARERSEPLDPLLDELVAATRARTSSAGMMSGTLGGGLLRMVARLVGARRTLEVGMFTGFSALAVAEALPEDGEVHCLELSEEYAAIAAEFFARSPHGKKIHVHLGPALENLERMEGPFDLAFIDADKGNYPEYYERCLAHLRPGGVVLVDNALWGGDVLAPETEDDHAIDRLNRIIETDERVDRLLLTVRDGIFLARKR